MIKAVGFKCVVKPKEVETKTQSGIVLALDKGMEERAQVVGTIVHIGEDFAGFYNPKSKFWGLSVGDEVFYAKYAGKWVVDPDTKEQLLILNDEDICGVISKEPADAATVVAA